MRRWLGTVLSALSLLLCVAACVLWVRSYQKIDLGGWERAGSVFYSLGSAQGRIILDRSVVYTRDGVLVATRSWELPGLSFQVFASRGPAGTAPAGWHAEISYWPLAVASALLPASWGVRAYRRRREVRRRLGLCPRCGYDLRATPGHCPECGAATERCP